MLLDLEQSDQLEDGAEALIPEARRRTRRRRGRRLALLALAFGAMASAIALLVGGGGGVIAGTSTTPFANADAFSGHGELAFISRGRLWVLDGSSGTLRELPTPRGYEAWQPSFSHDGRWLAYEAVSKNQYLPAVEQVWVARADGSGAHQVRPVPVSALIGWSPRADTFAVTVSTLRHGYYDMPTGVDLISPPGHVRRLYSVRVPARAPRAQSDAWGYVDQIEDAVWSPDGSQIAISVDAAAPRAGDTVLSVPVSGRVRVRVWLKLRNDRKLRAVGISGRLPQDVIVDLQAWWPRRGLGFWIYEFGMTHNNDSTPLLEVRAPGAEPRLVSQTLSDGQTDAVASQAGGELAVVRSGNGGRSIGMDKTVQVCGPHGGCRTLPGASSWSGPDHQPCKPCMPRPAPGKPGSGVSLDPAWSPNGKLLAYVKAPVTPMAAPTGPWFQEHSIYLWNAATGATSVIGRLDGGALPTWSADGRDLLFTSNDGLWLMPLATHRAVEIEHPLLPLSSWHPRASGYAWQVASYPFAIGYYGQVPWSQQFAWYSGAAG